MTDYLVIATAANDTVRIYAAVSTSLVETARLTHGTWPTATAAFGRILTGTVIMGVMSDNLHRLTVNFSGNGPLGKILAVSNQRGSVKGYPTNPQVDLNLNPLGKFDVAGAIGKGNLTVIKDHGLKEPYQGVVPIQSGEIAEDFAYYFTKSEQTPSAVALGVLVNNDGSVRAAGGLIVQLMPGSSKETASCLETNLKEIKSLTDLLNAGVTPPQLVSMVTANQGEVKFLEEVNLKYHCDCSRDRFRGPLLSLGREELNGILKEQGQIEVQCHFCNKLYHFQKMEIN